MSFSSVSTRLSPLTTSLTGVRLMPTVGERGSGNASRHSVFTSLDTPTWINKFKLDFSLPHAAYRCLRSARFATWMGVRSIPVEGERGSFRWPMWLCLNAGSGFSGAHLAILLSLDPMILIKDELKHNTEELMACRSWRVQTSISSC